MRIHGYDSKMIMEEKHTMPSTNIIVRAPYSYHGDETLAGKASNPHSAKVNWIPHTARY